MDSSRKQAVKDLPVTKEVYKEAFTLLKHRYENPQLIISSHMSNLVKLEKAVNLFVKELRNIFERVEGNIRALNTIRINSDHFAPLPIPIV